MTSLFELAFEHRFSCEHCDLATGKVCAEAQRLFAAALEKCERLQEPPTESKAKA